MDQTYYNKIIQFSYQRLKNCTWSLLFHKQI